MLLPALRPRRFVRPFRHVAHKSVFFLGMHDVLSGKCRLRSTEVLATQCLTFCAPPGGPHIRDKSPAFCIARHAESPRKPASRRPATVQNAASFCRVLCAQSREVRV